MSNRQDRPLAKKLLHALGLLALALFLLYVAVQFVLIFHRSYKTETAIRYTLAESLNLTGVVAFDAVDVPGSGNLGYLVQDGERVTNGTVVAECYTDDTQGLQRERLDRLERSITLLTKSQNSAGSELSVLTTRRSRRCTTCWISWTPPVQRHHRCRGCLSAGPEPSADQHRADGGFLPVHRSAADRVRRHQGTARHAADRHRHNERLFQPHGGLARHPDGLPGAGRCRPGHAAKNAGRRLPGSGYKPRRTDRDGLQLEILRGLRFGYRRTVRRSVHGENQRTRQAEHPAFRHGGGVTEDKDNGIAKIVLQCQTISAEVLGLGCETVQVDLKTYEGIRIDKAALHIVNGQRGVYVKYGNLQRFLKITTLYENDSYILVPEDGKLGSANEVRLYDEIIVQGTNLEDGKLL